MPVTSDLDPLKEAFDGLDADAQRRFKNWINTGDEFTRRERVAAALILYAKLSATMTPLEAQSAALEGLDFRARELFFDFPKNPKKHSGLRAEINKALGNGRWTTLRPLFPIS